MFGVLGFGTDGYSENKRDLVYRTASLTTGRACRATSTARAYAQGNRNFPSSPGLGVIFIERV